MESNLETLQDKREKDIAQKKVLRLLLAINFSMFVIEIVIGILSDSTALLADSLDMFADSTVYAISLYAVGKSMVIKNRAARLSGLFQIVLGLSVLLDIIRRLIWGSNPESFSMVAVGVAALFANTLCLYLIASHRKGEIHMRASWIFSKNDVIANLGVILGGILVYLLGSRIPDLLIGSLISLLVIRGGIEIVKDSREVAS